MKLAGINTSSQNNASSKKASLDNHENELRKQITDLQDKKKNISNDKDKTSEEKKKEKQAVQEEIQTLNSELRQYQIQKRQEEAARRQEELKEADKEAEKKDTDAEKLSDETKVFGNEAAGVLISLSATKKQIMNMQRIRTQLKGRQLTAATEDEKSSLQKKINKVASGIGRKVTITEENVLKFRDSRKKGADTRQSGSQTYDWKAQSDIVDMADDTKDIFHGNLAVNRKKFFNTVSVFIR